jgi:N-acylneuraminate cytidylyltransferase
MRAIIPAKAHSTRVPHKNWRPFYDGRSLVDLNIAALLGAGIRPGEIYVSCEEVDRLVEVGRRWGTSSLRRDPDLCDNSVPLTDWIRRICAQVPGDDDIVWSQVCDPLFDEHAQAIGAWPDVRQEGFDSLCVVHPFQGYLLDQECQPIGWGFGEWHTPSQNLPTLYTFPFTLSVLTRSAIERTGYHVGARPYWYVSRGESIDIDTPAEFEIARLRYAEKRQ